MFVKLLIVCVVMGVLASIVGAINGARILKTRVRMGKDRLTDPFRSTHLETKTVYDDFEVGFFDMPKGMILVHIICSLIIFASILGGIITVIFRYFEYIE